MNKVNCFLIGILVSLCLPVFSQTETDSLKKEVKIMVISLYVGDAIIGEILSDDGREILVNTTTKGKYYISKDKIKEISELNKEGSFNQEDYFPEGPFTTRYAFTTNALPIKKYVNYAMVNIYGPEIHFAVTNKLSLGVMTTWLGSPAAITAKYTFKTNNDKINLALGNITGVTLYDIFDNRGFGSLNWATITFGDRISNLSFSSGFLFTKNTNSNLDVRKGPMFSVAGIVKVGKKSSLFFDSMLAYTEKNEDVYQNNPYNYTVESIVQKVGNISFFVMPGFRYQQADDKAFQFSFAGVMNYKRYNGDGFVKINSFPIPMCSWFYKL